MTGSAIAVRNIDDLTRVAKAYATSGYWPDARDVAQAFVKISFGAEVGLPAYIAMSEVHIIQGKPTLGAGALAALVKGNAGYDYRILEHTAEACAIEFFTVAGERESLGTSRFTIEDAQTAGLMSNPTWKKYARNMLFARAMSNGVAWYCPDVTMGRVYTPDEMESVVDAEVVDEPAGVSAEVLAADEPADIALWQTAERLTAELSVVTAAVSAEAQRDALDQAASNRALNEDDPGAHVKWLEDVLAYARAGAAVAATERDERPPATAAQKKKLGVLVGRLRDGLNLTTEHLYRAVGHDLIPGDDGELHFGPLLQSLTKAEAHALIDRLERYEATLGVPAS